VGNRLQGLSCKEGTIRWAYPGFLVDRFVTGFGLPACFGGKYKVESRKQKPRIAGVVPSSSSPFRLDPSGLGVHRLLITDHCLRLASAPPDLECTP
jgi:hypothetical protein